MFDFRTVLAIASAVGALIRAAKGASKSAKDAKNAHAEWLKSAPPGLHDAIELAVDLVATDGPTDAEQLFAAAGAFRRGHRWVHRRIRAGDTLTILDGRAALVGEDGRIHLGDRV